MRPLLLSIVFIIVLLSFIANPAPQSIELSDVMLIGLTGAIGILCATSTTVYKIHRTESELLLAVMLYLGYLLLSTLIGLLHGVPLLNVLRSIGPYISFFPLIFIGFLPERLVRANAIGSIFIAIGLLQIAYLFYLYFSHTNDMLNTAGVLRNRITLMDPRTTLPLLLAVSILPLSGKKIGAFFILIGLLAGMMTLTRAIFLSILVGWMVFIAFYIYHQSRLQLFSLPVFLNKLGRYTLTILVLLLLISAIPKIHLLETGLYTRFVDHTANGNHVDYSNGRLYDEWLPALTTWLHSGYLSLFFGIGAGNTFTVLSGEERTYIHNLSIYSLVYGGLYGLFSCLWLYYVVFKTLLIRAFQTHDVVYIAFSALLASLFFYGQLFAVHKGLAFNVMLFLIIGLTLSQPIIRNR